MVITTNGSICTQLYKQPKFDEYMTHKIFLRGRGTITTMMSIFFSDREAKIS